MGGVFFSRKYSRRLHRDPQKFIYKQVNGRNGVHEWLRLTNALRLCDLLWKVYKCHASNREGSFNDIYIHTLCTAVTTMLVYCLLGYKWSKHLK